ncbi:MAG: ParB/RepB/Spo0J family partition protein [Pseudomonadota bacterium]
MSAVAQRNNGRLGRGLASLMGDGGPNGQALPPEGQQRVVPIDQVRPSPLNPRASFPEDELEEMAASILEKGLVQPLVVRPFATGGFEIVAGERRWRAAQRAQLTAIPAIVRDLSDQDVLELAIIENVQRSDLNAIEEARGYQELISRYDYTQEDLGRIIGKSRSHLANTLRLLRLPDSVQDFLQAGALTAGHARALVGRADAEELAALIVDKGLSVREVEALVQAVDGSGKGDRAKPAKREKDADTRAFEHELSEALGLKVEVKPGSGESGTLTIKYGNFDQLDYIRQRLLTYVMAQ